MIERRGYIRLSRRLFDSDLWTKKRVFAQAEAWIDLIQMAAWKAGKHSTVKYGSLELKRGELVVSQRWLAARWRWGHTMVRDFLDFLQKETQLEARQKTQAGTVYLLVNYDRYQSPPRPEDTLAIAAEDTPRTHLGHTSTRGESGTPSTQKGHKIETSKQLKETTTASPAVRNGKPSWIAPLYEDWERVMDAVPTVGKMLKPFGALLKRHPVEEVRPVWCGYLQAVKDSPKDYGVNVIYFCENYGKLAEAHRTLTPDDAVAWISENLGRKAH